MARKPTPEEREYLAGLLMADLSREHRDEINRWVLEDAIPRVELLWEQIEQGKPPAPHRASYALHGITNTHLQYLQAYRHRMIDFLPKAGHEGIQRSLLRALCFLPLPKDEDKVGELYEFAFDRLQNPQAAIAVRVFAMQACFNIAQKWPELQEELALVIESHLPYGSAGFKNRGGKLLKKLQKSSQKRK